MDKDELVAATTKSVCGGLWDEGLCLLQAHGEGLRNEGREEAVQIIVG